MHPFVCSLDLGKLNDPAAFAAMQMSGDPTVYEVRFLKRMLGWPYTAMVDKVMEWMNSPFLSGAPLVIDETGCGTPVADMFRVACLKGPFIPIWITGGNSLTVRPTGGYNVSKSLLVSNLQVLLGTRRIIWQPPSVMPEAKVLEKELNAFQVTLTEAANEIYEGRKGEHDDTVLSIALGTWYGENIPETYSGPLVLNEFAQAGIQTDAQKLAEAKELFNAGKVVEAANKAQELWLSFYTECDAREGARKLLTACGVQVEASADGRPLVPVFNNDLDADRFVIGGVEVDMREPGFWEPH